MPELGRIMVQLKIERGQISAYRVVKKLLQCYIFYCKRRLIHVASSLKKTKTSLTIDDLQVWWLRGFFSKFKREMLSESYIVLNVSYVLAHLKNMYIYKYLIYFSWKVSCLPSFSIDVVSASHNTPTRCAGYLNQENTCSSSILSCHTCSWQFYYRTTGNKCLFYGIYCSSVTSFITTAVVMKDDTVVQYIP